MPFAVVTGASGGIGLALCRLLAARGYGLLLVGRDATRLAAISVELGSDTQPFIADLEREADVAALSTEIANRVRLDLFVCCHGISEPDAVAKSDATALSRQISINLTASMILMAAGVRRMIRQNTGNILCIGSQGAFGGMGDSAAYAASKFGLRGFCLSLIQELRGTGVGLTLVHPGAVDTPMLRHEAAAGGSALNFLNERPMNAEHVATAALKALDAGKSEIILPVWDSLSMRLVSGWPDLLHSLLPTLLRHGEKGRKRYLSRG
ncbi:SDR family NAD(P)-dependent oxidoreductase [Asticcacaulis sp. BYS171W]|uniref:SDR family NAD(P)-dependent oxidoreductase n=1 Tax=Asticcacaulis aquaticus TaxID=2984212 RepID=A0ABT5HUL7_9CAUL|nr:SDR family NAD(P)-dependent oxidoreductase [Asticcacaulis aquaticus]MDC7683729.1 SDR family NAD(P)-dependent oxidoreductase [Asticcacaulis aquaticus]